MRNWWIWGHALEVVCLLPFNCRLGASLSSFSCGELKCGISANTYVLVASLDPENLVGVCLQPSRDCCKLWAWPGTLQSFKPWEPVLRLMILDMQLIYSVLKTSFLYKTWKKKQCELGLFWWVSLTHCSTLKLSGKFFVCLFFFSD